MRHLVRNHLQAKFEKEKDERKMAEKMEEDRLIAEIEKGIVG